ncbi:MAG: hypothetical protein ACTHNU_08795 [Gaiellales bacterium]
MYDPLRARYRFHCPHQPEGERSSVPLSAFRRLERLPGAAHPALYRVEFGCRCGEDHAGLLSHGDLDYGPLGEVEVEFQNLLTGRSEKVGGEMAELARQQVQRGNWPWCLYCSREARLTPVYPSCLQLVLPHETSADLVGVAMRCPGCEHMTVNLVSADHLDVPFYHDRVVHYLDRPYGDERDLTLERFHDQLHSSHFDSERARFSDAA